jgi:hypothetical protein
LFDLSLHPAVSDAEGEMAINEYFHLRQRRGKPCRSVKGIRSASAKVCLKQAMSQT